MMMSQAEFAEAIKAAGIAVGFPNHCTKRLVQKWETGEHAECRPGYLRVLQTMTGYSVSDLGFTITWDGAENSTAASELKTVDDDPDSASATPIAPSHHADPTADWAMDQLNRVLEHPSTATVRDARIVETATASHFNLEQHTPARVLTPIVARHLTRVTALLIAAQRAHPRDALTASAGRTTLLAGWLAFDRGNTPASLRYWETAISTAEGTGDNALLAAALTYQSYAAARSGDPESAWQLALNASKHTGGDLRAHAWATSRIALHAAQHGEYNSAHIAMTTSLEFGASLPNPRPGDTTTPWTRSFGYARLLATTAHTAALLKEPNAADLASQAVEALTEAKVKVGCPEDLGHWSSDRLMPRLRGSSG